MIRDDDDSIDWRIVARHLAKAATREEDETVARWVAEEPARRAELELLRAAWNGAATLPVTSRAAGAYPRFAARAGLEGVSGSDAASQTPALVREAAAPRESEPHAAPTSAALAVHPAARGERPRVPSLDTPRRRAPWLRAGVWLAASFLLAIAVAIAERGGHDAAPGTASSTPVREFATRRAQRASVDLIDGTRVMLGPESRLRVPADFGAARRVVDLEGEGYFEVAHDARRPFMVRTRSAVAEDLGTTFVVRAYPGDSVAEVAVAEGKVALRARSDGSARGVALTRGQVGSAAASGLISVDTGADLAPYLGWTTGSLTFRKAPLDDVRRALERWYDVRIELSDSSLARVPVSASFDNKAVDDALRSLARLLDVRYERTGSVARLMAEPEP
ncbi:MAG TPA: FecR domain-containing protein [Gemmatimonadaceae bacterium]